MRLRDFFATLAAFGLLHSALMADEGMWPINQFPREAVRKNHSFQVTDEFLRNLQRSSVRFNNGGSGSFVSPSGLLFTNHHVGSDCIQKLSDPQNDYMAKGFYAATQAAEKQCPDLELNILVRLEEVTGAVNREVKPDMPAAEANRVRKAAMGEIEKDCGARTGLRCDVVTLYSGGRYDLYQYKKYTDVRLVFAPEAAIAAFGGDPDNFTFPRYCLDFAFFRAYENGVPVKPDSWFRWSKAGAREGELIFVPGNPGSTGRLIPLAGLEFLRDHSYPMTLRRLQGLVRTLREYSAGSAEAKRAARDNLMSQENSLKAYTGFQRGLTDLALMARKAEEERQLQKAVQANPELRQKYGHVWPEMAGAYSVYREFYKPYYGLELTAIRGSDLFSIARDVVRYTEEKQKPSSERLREYQDSALPSLELSMFSPAPITNSMEIAALEEYFRFLRQELGPDHPVIRQLESAATYVNTSKLQDVAERKRLAGNPEAVRNSDDGMIRLARLLDPSARELRKRYEDRVEAVLLKNQAALAQARFATSGDRIYPDATFTFRVAFGPIKGYEANGKRIPWATRIKGLFERATGVEPFALPESWKSARDRVEMDTPFNFVSTADTHGGNSGSPTIDTKGEIVGILFDGNMEGLPNRFVYSDVQARSIHVASQGIVEALDAVYGAERLLDELGVKKAAAKRR
ncbi:MAG: S46 family peptidase [Bryobacteraceae bacterium]